MGSSFCIKKFRLQGEKDPFNDTILADRKIAIWGTGETERNFRSACRENGYNINADFYIENDLKKETQNTVDGLSNHFQGDNRTEIINTFTAFSIVTVIPPLQSNTGYVLNRCPQLIFVR